MSIKSIIPLPVRLTERAGSFPLTGTTAILASGTARAIGQKLACAWAPALGFHLTVIDAAEDRANAIALRLDPALVGQLGPEGYLLTVSADRVDLRAASEAGLFYGTQTLLQLLPADIFRAAPVAGAAWELPCVEIEDRPRFGWRGAMLDTVRYFMPKSFVKKFIDLLALHKFNRFHWHLTDDQGWRIEIKRYPRLTEVGAWRKETVSGHWRHNQPNTYDGKPHGGFYTQDDIREIVAYAAERFITVMPEIEMPGHAQAAIAAYQELGNTDVLPAEPLEVSPNWGVNDHVFNVNEETILFLQGVLDEVRELFPGPYIHVGGDECPKREWQASPAAQARRLALGLADEEELQSYFIRRMDDYLVEHGRRLVGWDEILEGGLAPNAIVMSWRGEKGGIAAAQAGHDVIMASNRYTYFDYLQSEDPATEPLGIGGFISLEKAYSFDPIPAELTPDQGRHIIGAQGQLWTEYISEPRHLEYMAFPRLAALAEVVWTPAERKDYGGFRARLSTHLQRLDILDVNYRKPVN